MNSFWKYYGFIISLAIIQKSIAVFHGNNVALGKFNYAVAILNVRCCRPICTGSLIDSRHILTAGHCVQRFKASNLAVAAGVVDWAENMNAEVRLVKTIHLHPFYRPPRTDASLLTYCLLFACECVLGPARWKLYSKNDIAVLTLQAPVQTGKNIGVVGLPNVLTPPPYGTRCFFLGWGDSESSKTVLRWTKFKILKPEQCPEVDLRVKGEICARDSKKISYTAPGDSGGPLVCNGIVTGILQIGANVANHAATFPLVSHYVTFIEEACAD